MKKYSYYLAFVCLAAMPLGMSARRLSPAEAIGRVKSEMPRRAAAFGARSDMQPSVTVTDSLSEPMAYVFAGTAGGYMVVSADDVAPALLGYSDNGTISADNMPENLRYWLDCYASEISRASAIASLSGTENLSAARDAVSDRPYRKPVAPLVTTRWNQGAPYYNDCPVYNGDTCVTGCVATALSQVMNYHQWPKTGQGSVSYTTSKLGIQVDYDFSATTFEWDKMLDVYTGDSPKASCDAVAELMAAVGAAVNMNYTPSESGTASAQALALFKYFDYDKAIVNRERAWYTRDEWEEIIYNELVNVGPVYYCGANSRAGHAFVCDGYSADGFFHFNWGWGGMSDGYFLLSALDPSSQGIGGSTAGYSYGQVIVTGAQPPKSGSEITYLMSIGSDAFRPTESTGKMNSTVTFGGGIYNRSIVAIPDTLKINAGVKLTSLADGSVRYVLSENVKGYSKGLDPAYGWNTIKVKFTSSINSGEYLVEPVYSVHNKWENLLTMYSFNRTVCYMTVSGNDLTFSNVRPGFKVSDLTFTPIYLDNKFRVEAHFENPGSEEFYSGICGAFWSIDNEEDGPYAVGQVLALNAMPDEDGNITYISDFFRKSDDFEAGDYYFVFVDYVAYLFGDWLTYSEPIRVTVNPAPADAVKVVCSTLSASGVVIDDVTTVDVSARVHCTAGYFCAPLYAYVFDSQGNNRGGGASESIFFDKGNSLDVKFSINVNKLNPKLKYQLAIYTLTNGSWNNLRSCNFSVTESSALDDIDMESSDAPVRYFTLQGVEVTSDCLCPGQIYICRQGADVTKVIAN